MTDAPGAGPCNVTPLHPGPVPRTPQEAANLRRARTWERLLTARREAQAEQIRHWERIAALFGTDDDLPPGPQPA